jgi:hypothetical protein
MKNVPLPPKKGSKLRDTHNNLYHVRAIVDYKKGKPDEREYVLVLRYWARNAWSYRTATCWELELGLLKLA